MSRETTEETESRLRGVLARADLVVLPGIWSFLESPLHEPPLLDGELLAVVRDETTWSALRPYTGQRPEVERFGVFSFHFPTGLDNSGFVGWLATELKARLGTGVFVICGSNTDRGGVYDYWGCPVDLLHNAIELVTELAGRSTRPLGSGTQ